eukprot:881382-Prorocentrum_minimum.AAC.1
MTESATPLGFLAAEHECDYVVLHQLDLLPLTGVSFNYPHLRRYAHLVSAGSVTSASQPDSQHPRYCGGAFAVDAALFRVLNGYGNGYWDWGGEDDDFCLRLMAHLHGSWTAAKRCGPTSKIISLRALNRNLLADCIYPRA